jgi:hypothetical protein
LNGFLKRLKPGLHTRQTAAVVTGAALIVPPVEIAHVI